MSNAGSNAGPQFETVIRVELPSGGWWELESRPRWKHVREWASEVGRLSAGEVADRVLVSLTGPVRQIAEELFAGLVTGTVPPGFAEVHIMAATGWDWAKLQSTPADVVRRMVVYLFVREARANGGSLEFD